MIILGQTVITSHEIIVLVNVLTFLLFGFDKLMAKRKKLRIPELLLLLLSLFCGGAGALFGMVVFNHKTSKLAFRILVPLGAVLNEILYRDTFYFLRQFFEFLHKLIIK